MSKDASRGLILVDEPSGSHLHSADVRVLQDGQPVRLMCLCRTGRMLTSQWPGQAWNWVRDPPDRPPQLDECVFSTHLTRWIYGADSVDIYASSETFEIKASGSAYPPQGAAGGTGGSSSSASASASGSSAASSVSGAAASATSKSAANPRAINPLMHGAAAAGYLFDLFVDDEKRSYLPFRR